MVGPSQEQHSTLVDAYIEQVSKKLLFADEGATRAHGETIQHGDPMVVQMMGFKLLKTGDAIELCAATTHPDKCSSLCRAADQVVGSVTHRL